MFLEDREIELKEGGVFLIGTGKRYYVIGENFVIAMPSSPAWYPE